MINGKQFHATQTIKKSTLNTSLFMLLGKYVSFKNLETKTFFWKTESYFNTLKNDWNNKLLIIEKKPDAGIKKIQKTSWNYALSETTYYKQKAALHWWLNQATTIFSYLLEQYIKIYTHQIQWGLSSNIISVLKVCGCLQTYSVQWKTFKI